MIDRLIERTPWLAIVAIAVIGTYAGILIYKLLRAEEGFVLGYKGWVLGKWTRPTRFRAKTQDPLRRLRRQNEALEASGRSRKEVILLSRLLDADLAYLLVNERLDWERKLQRLVQSLVSGVACTIAAAGPYRCGFFILEDDNAHLVLAVGEGHDVAPFRLPLDRSCAGRAFQTGETHYCRDLETDPIWSRMLRGPCSYRSLACVPIRAGQVVWGVLCMEAQEPDAFAADDLLYLEMFAAKLAVICSFHSLQISG